MASDAWVWVVVLSASLVGCSDEDGATCAAELYPPVDARCEDAIRLAALDSEQYRPTDAEVTAYFDILQAARSLDARFDRIRARNLIAFDAIHVSTDHPDVGDAWSMGQVLTGVSALDGILIEAQADSVRRVLDDGLYLVEFAAILNVSNVVADLDSLELVDAEAAQANELEDNQIRLTPGAERAEVEFVVGWGDCFSGCLYSHAWAVSVDLPSGPAELISEVGDPLPPSWQE